MEVREQLKLVRDSTRFSNPHKTEGFREGMEIAEKICDEIISYHEALKTIGEDSVYCPRCRAELLDYVQEKFPFCPFCGQKIKIEEE